MINRLLTIVRGQRHWGLLSLCLAAGMTEAKAQSLGYGFLGGTIGRNGPGGGFRFGIGGEWAVAPRVTLGGEVGGIHKGSMAAVVSGNAGLHFKRSVREGWDPFVTGGVSVLGRWSGETGVYANIGGGANYWFRPRLAVRGEFRAYPGGYDLTSFSEFRFGISFR